MFGSKIIQAMDIDGWRRRWPVLSVCACAKATPFKHWWPVRGENFFEVTELWDPFLRREPARLPWNRLIGRVPRMSFGSREPMDEISMKIEFRVGRYTTVIKTTPFFDRTKNYIYNGVRTSNCLSRHCLPGFQVKGHLMDWNCILLHPWNHYHYHHVFLPQILCVVMLLETSGQRGNDFVPCDYATWSVKSLDQRLRSH